MADPATIARLREAGHLLVFTGAGVSAESGIPTFRDDDGFWSRFPPDEFANWTALARKMETEPVRLAEFLREVIEPVAKARPNAAHEAIAAWQSRASVEVVTQNIDGLHQTAGSRTVHEVHGSLLERIDLAGQRESPVDRATLAEVAQRLTRVRTRLGLIRAVHPIVGPEASLPLRPAVVLFGDAMAEPDWDDAIAAAESCDACLTVGTSAQVYPAAMLPEVVAARGCPVVSVGLEPPSVGEWAEGRASEVVPTLLATSPDA